MTEIVELLSKNPDRFLRSQIVNNLSFAINYKTLQRRLFALADEERIVKIGDRKAAKYYPAKISQQEIKGPSDQKEGDVFSQESRNVLRFLELSRHSREKVSYKSEFIEDYTPNETTCVPKERREALFKEGKRFDEVLAAGTDARQICQRLLIDLSYNSSRL